MSKIQEIAAAVEALKQKMKEEGKVALNEAFKEFFDKHPEAKKICWTQYTPHFNDGDACTFGVHEFELKVDYEQMADDVQKMLEDQDTDYGYGDGCAISALTYLTDPEDSPWNPRVKAGVAARTLTESESSLVEDFNNLERDCNSITEVLETVLGDHALVRATRKGFKVTECSHD